MTPAECNATILTPALLLLPEAMDTPQARAMLLAIGLQESRLEYRKQIGGPARGLWQFEKGGGVAGVLHHQATKQIARTVCRERQVWAGTDYVYDELKGDDILAACFARLLLWTCPHKLPQRDEPEMGWEQYLDTWRPGKPHPAHWSGNWQAAWAAIG